MIIKGVGGGGGGASGGGDLSSLKWAQSPVTGPIRLQSSSFIARLFCHNPLTDCHGAAFDLATELCAVERKDDNGKKRGKEKDHLLSPPAGWRELKIEIS